MPIRPENRKRYPANWREISLRIKAKARWCCETCGVPHGQYVYRLKFGGFEVLPWHEAKLHGTWRHSIVIYEKKYVRVMLTTAHLDHQPENCTDENLKALCQRCHNAYDSAMRRAGIKQRNREALNMGDLFDDACTKS